MGRNSGTTQFSGVHYLHLADVSPVRGDRPVGGKHRTDPDSRAAEQVLEGGEEPGCQPQDLGYHRWIQGPSGEPATGEEVEECCGEDLVLWPPQV